MVWSRKTHFDSFLPTVWDGTVYKFSNVIRLILSHYNLYPHGITRISLIISFPNIVKYQGRRKEFFNVGDFKWALYSPYPADRRSQIGLRNYLWKY